MSDDENDPSGPDSGSAALSAAALERLDRQRKYQEVAERPDYEENLRTASERYREEFELASGALVQWKPNMRSHLFPDYGRPMVVIGPIPDSVLQRVPIFANSATDEIYDLYVAYLDGDLDFSIFKVDSRRIQPYET